MNEDGCGPFVIRVSKLRMMKTVTQRNGFGVVVGDVWGRVGVGEGGGGGVGVGVGRLGEGESGKRWTERMLETGSDHGCIFLDELHRHFKL